MPKEIEKRPKAPIEPYDVPLPPIFGVNDIFRRDAASRCFTNIPYDTIDDVRRETDTARSNDPDSPVAQSVRLDIIAAERKNTNEI